ncbi:MAG: CRISPR-associated endoribonuclease Cas6 [Herpetosiphon sp.]|nr:CRISPR-associated endoribonuclease Cas6 [Herpetosiphon sp.]
MLHTSPDLMACVVHLSAVRGLQMERSQGHRAHALFLNVIEASDPVLAERLHADVPIKPWTIAPLAQRNTQLRIGDGYPLRVAFLQADLYLPFARTFLEQPQRDVTLGAGVFRLHSIQTTAQSSHWAGVTAWSELIAKAVPADYITLRFASPTAFAQGTDKYGKKRISLFPNGEAVFGSLLRRWNAFSPRQLDENILDAVDILPKRYELKTEVMLMRKNEQLGFVGDISYKITGDETARHVVSALADAALYLGVGYKTTHGMGLVRRIQNIEQRP